MLDINKQEMKYSQSGQRVFIPQTDENGDIVYEGYNDSDGNFVPYLDSSATSYIDFTTCPMETLISKEEAATSPDKVTTFSPNL